MCPSIPELGAISGLSLEPRTQGLSSSRPLKRERRDLVYSLSLQGVGRGETLITSLLSLLVLYLAPRGFSLGTSVFPSLYKTTFDLILLYLELI